MLGSDDSKTSSKFLDSIFVIKNEITKKNMVIGIVYEYDCDFWEIGVDMFGEWWNVEMKFSGRMRKWWTIKL